MKVMHQLVPVSHVFKQYRTTVGMILAVVSRAQCVNPTTEFSYLFLNTKPAHLIQAVLTNCL